MSQITQKGATSGLALQAGGTFQTSTDANFNTVVGTRFDLSDGREVMLVSNGATAIGTSGVLCQDAAIVANHQGLVVTAFTAYSANGNTPASVTVTLGATALIQNQYQGGFLLVDSGPGIGQTLRIASNPAAVLSATGVVITLEDGPNTALTTSSTVCLIPPHGANIVINPTTSTGAIAGVTLYPLAVGQIAGGTAGTLVGFIATKGLVACLSDASVATVGQGVAPSITTVGAVTVTSGTQATVGYANQTGVSAKARSIFLDV